MTDETKYPFIWRVKRISRKSIYLFKRFSGGIIRWRPFALFAPWIVTTYLAVLDVWGDKWECITLYPKLHAFLFWFTVGSTMLILFLRGIIGEAQPLDSSEIARNVMSDFIATVGAIVDAKNVRFRASIPNIKPNSDKFKHITDPVSQFRIISNALVSFICKNYGLDQDQVDVTIARRKPLGSWHFHYRHQDKWKHTSPPNLMATKSAAASCLEAGEPEFYPDKIDASGKGKYFMSDRDKRRGDGSVFVYPVVIPVPNGSLESVISIVTYDKQLCEAHESKAKAITKALLSEICRRYELELCLDAIKTEC